MKLYIFDLDGTLYSKNNIFFSYLDKKTEKYIKDKTKITDEEYNELEKKVLNVLDAINKLKIEKTDFYKSVYSNIKYEDFFCKDYRLIELLKDIDAKKVIVSLSPYGHIKKVIELLGIEELIDEIYSNEDRNYNDKKRIYKEISNKYNIPFCEMCVIGDNYEIDLKGAEELGCNTIYITREDCNNNKKEAQDIYSIKI